MLVGVAEALTIRSGPGVGDRDLVLGGEDALVQGSSKGHHLAHTSWLEDGLDAAGVAVLLRRGTWVGGVHRARVRQDQELARGRLHDDDAAPVRALGLDDLVNRLLGHGLQVRVDCRAHCRAWHGGDLIMLTGGDDGAGLADLDAPAPVHPGQGLVLGQLQAGGADELTRLALVGVAHHVARDPAGRVAAPGALVWLDAGDLQRLDLAPGVRCDGLGDDDVGGLPHHLRPELLGVHPQDRRNLSGRRHRAIPDDGAHRAPGGRVLTVLLVLVLSNPDLVDSDVVGDRRGRQYRAVAPQDLAALGAVDPRDRPLGLGLVRQGRPLDDLEPGGPGGQHTEAGQTEELKCTTATGVHCCYFAVAACPADSCEPPRSTTPGAAAGTIPSSVARWVRWSAAEASWTWERTVSMWSLTTLSST